MSDTIVGLLTFSCLYLQPCLDHVAGCREIRRRHTSDSTRCKELDDAQFLVGSFTEEVAFQVIVSWEVDGGERSYQPVSA